MALRSLAVWTLVLISLVFSHACVLPKTVYPDLLKTDTEELVRGLENGLWTSVDLVTAYTLRIQEVQPILNTVTEINPDAIAIAETLDAERANGTIRGPLHGIPLLIKNNIATNDKMNNTAGSYALLGAKVPRDSTIAAKLRRAGVIILGKSNMSQWAVFRSSNSSNGWSALGGQVYGAYYPNMDPSGSSSGSGVASSVGLALASLGTETDGSIISPSSQNNLVGIKPTVGLTSRSLVIPISQHQDTVGPMARTVKDAAYVLSAIAGKDDYDNYTSAQPFDTPPDYTQALNFSSLRGARIGIPRNAIYLFEGGEPVFAAFDDAIRVIEQAGGIIVDNANYSAYQDFLTDARADLGNGSIVLDADFISDLATYLGQLTYNPNNVHSLADIRNFTQSFGAEEYPARDTAIWDEALSLGYNNSDARFWQAYQYTSYLGGEGGVMGALQKYHLDALIMPTDFASSLPAKAGLPVVTVPLGFYPSNTTIQTSEPWGLVGIGPNIPFGLSFLGPKWSEETLIGFAYALKGIPGNYERGIEPHEDPITCFYLGRMDGPPAPPGKVDGPVARLPGTAVDEPGTAVEELGEEDLGAPEVAARDHAVAQAREREAVDEAEADCAESTGESDTDDVAHGIESSRPLFSSADSTVMEACDGCRWIWSLGSGKVLRVLGLLAITGSWLGGSGSEVDVDVDVDVVFDGMRDVDEGGDDEDEAEVDVKDAILFPINIGRSYLVSMLLASFPVPWK
ncbi:amidase [Phlyctema vagabunda]|uniref:Amidase n=1 Tax=Phlyctema vagabunda TaxID=108571 RepID=A0ABR4P7Q1_9HELO